MKLRITHVEGSKKGQVETFEVPVLTLGRDPSNLLVFDPIKDDRVSTKHAALSEQSGGVIVTDLGSRNGTFVNGQRISGPTPVPAGALVQLGENGPMFMVAYEVAKEPAPAAPAQKGGGGGLCIVLALVGFLLIGVLMLVLFLLFHGKHRGGNPWARVGVGSSFEMQVETHMTKPIVSDTKMTTKQTIVSRTDDTVHVKTETTVSGQTTAQEMDIPLKTEGDNKPKEKPTEEKDESVTVPAGTYDSHYVKMKTDTSTTEVWTNEDVPVPVKTVVTTDTMTTTMVLVKVDKK